MTLSSREQWLVAAAIAFVVVVGLGRLVVAPLVAQTSLLDRKVAQKRQELVAFGDLEAQLARLTERYQEFEERVTSHREGFSLFVELESLAQRSGLKDRIESFKPGEHPVGDYREQTVDIDLKGLTLEELARLLRDIERSRESLYVKRIEVAEELRGREGSPGRLKVKLTVGTLVGRVS
ncbi:MAG: type 4a pilus biogenesis protein PilO [Nitrospirota bacterium]|jgi:Tfp pilus assembly protein PilO